MIGKTLLGAGLALLLASTAQGQIVGGCPGGQGARSVKSEEPVRISFRNGTDETLTAFWINFDGDRERYADIPSGGRWSVDTYATHPWAFVTQFGQCVALHTVSEGERRFTIR